MKFGFTFDFMLMCIYIELELHELRILYSHSRPIVTQYFASVLSLCTSGSACDL